jgi:glucan biosynthesis protein
MEPQLHIIRGTAYPCQYRRIQPRRRCLRAAKLASSPYQKAGAASFTRMPPSATVDAPLWIDANGEVLERYTRCSEVTEGWKFVVRFRTLDRGKPMEARAHLKRWSQAVSETWGSILSAG